MPHKCADVNTLIRHSRQSNRAQHNGVRCSSVEQGVEDEDWLEQIEGHAHYESAVESGTRRRTQPSRLGETTGQQEGRVFSHMALANGKRIRQEEY
jgi:hypothetical protein